MHIIIGIIILVIIIRLLVNLLLAFIGPSVELKPIKISSKDLNKFISTL